MAIVLLKEALSNMMAKLQVSFWARWDLTEHRIETVRPPGYTRLSTIKKACS